MNQRQLVNNVLTLPLDFQLKGLDDETSQLNIHKTNRKLEVRGNDIFFGQMTCFSLIIQIIRLALALVEI